MTLIVSTLLLSFRIKPTCFYSAFERDKKLPFERDENLPLFGRDKTVASVFKSTGFVNMLQFLKKLS